MGETNLLSAIFSNADIARMRQQRRLAPNHAVSDEMWYMLAYKSNE